MNDGRSTWMMALVVVTGCAAPAVRTAERDRLAIWVTRWDYRTSEDVRAIVANSALLGATDVLWQCSGQADAYYRSTLEPWGELIGGKDPAFDPLALAVSEAHSRKLRLHAWVNVMPVWRGKEPPQGVSALYARHPEWVVVGKDGKPQPLNESYLCANPAHDAWVRHVCAVAADIASRYEVDGIHLDYIRYLEGDWSYDEETLNQFGFLYAATPREKPAEWTGFRRGLVTGVVHKMRDAVKRARPEAEFTAAVYPSKAARDRIHQDAERWVREGLVDAVFPMQYGGNDAQFEEIVREARASFGERCFPGIGVYKHATADQTARQMEIVQRLGFRGVALFCYANFWETPDESYRATPNDLREARVRAVSERRGNRAAGAD